MWRRSLHERFGRFDPSFRSAGDYEFWLRISGQAKFLHVPQVLGLFLDAPGSLSHGRTVNDAETELARERYWPKEWGPRLCPKRSLLDRLTRRSTYRQLAGRWFRSRASSGQ